MRLKICVPVWWYPQMRERIEKLEISGCNQSLYAMLLTTWNMCHFSKKFPYNDEGYKKSKW